MNSGQQSIRRLRRGWGPSICRSCRDAISRRTYAAAAAAAVKPEEPTVQNISPEAQSSPQTSYAINAGVVISRPPQLTRDLHPFEAAFFLYQRRLNERLSRPFSRYFYIKKDTPADREWKRKILERLSPARDIGRYSGYGAEAWNDEVLVGAKESEFEHQMEKLIEDVESSGATAEEAEAPVTGEAEVERESVEKPMPRVTEADQKGDMKSLNRALQRTLYLLVRNKDGRWEFPQDRLKDEHLHGAAHRIITQAGGHNMNTWLVSNNPIGHHTTDYKEPQTSGLLKELGSKTFFIKVRIMAGQLSLKDNQLGLQDFTWLAKEEVKKQVDFNYWQSIKNMLAER